MSANLYYNFYFPLRVCMGVCVRGFTWVYPDLSAVSAKHPPFPPVPSSCPCLTGRSVCSLAQSSVVCVRCTNNKLGARSFKITAFLYTKSFPIHTPLLHFHHDLLHFFHLLLQLLGLCLFFLCLSFRVLKSQKSRVNVCFVCWWVQKTVMGHSGASTWALWNICRLRVLTWSSWTRSAASVSCFSCVSFSSSFMATSISCFRPTWSSSSCSSSWHNAMQYKWINTKYNKTFFILVCHKKLKPRNYNTVFCLTVPQLVCLSSQAKCLIYHGASASTLVLTRKPNRAHWVTNCSHMLNILKVAMHRGPPATRRTRERTCGSRRFGLALSENIASAGRVSQWVTFIRFVLEKLTIVELMCAVLCLLAPPSRPNFCHSLFLYQAHTPCADVGIKKKHDPHTTNLANALFFLVLLPNHVVHLVQALPSLFVCLQLYLAILQGCLWKSNPKYTIKVNVLPFTFHVVSWTSLVTSSFFWLDCRMDSFSCRSCSCSSRRELILSVAAVSWGKRKTIRWVTLKTQLLSHIKHERNHNHTQHIWPPLQACCWSSLRSPS